MVGLQDKIMIFEDALSHLRKGGKITRDYGVWKKMGHYLMLDKYQTSILLFHKDGKVKGHWNMTGFDLLYDKWEIHNENINIENKQGFL